MLETYLLYYKLKMSCNNKNYKISAGCNEKLFYNPHLLRYGYTSSRIFCSSLEFYILRRYCPPTEYKALVICPNEQYFTVSINSSKRF